jgi:Zn finger protein HypA/HybF involved in hydrogenase expression
MKKQADMRIIDVTLEVGELVLVKLQPFRQQFVAMRKNNKLG